MRPPPNPTVLDQKHKPGRKTVLFNRPPGEYLFIAFRLYQNELKFSKDPRWEKYVFLHYIRLDFQRLHNIAKDPRRRNNKTKFITREKGIGLKVSSCQS